MPDAPVDIVDGIASELEQSGVIPDPLGAEPAAPINGQSQESAPEGSETTEGTTEPDTFTKLDPNTLPPEVRPYYQSMLADYRRKTQGVAEQRRQFEELGDVDSLRQASELYSYLNDPNNLREFYAQLHEHFGVAGQPTPATTPTAVPDGFEDDDDSPALQALRAELTELRTQMTAREQNEQLERMQWALVGEVNRQDALLKEQHPDWGDEEWNAVYGMAPMFEGNLLQAAQVYDEAANARLARLLNGKAAVASTEGLVPAPVRPAVQPAAVSGEDDQDLSIATKQAMEYLRNVFNQDVS